MTAYYNEIDPFAAEWLENLILVGAIAPGIVDRRSIEDVAPSDLAGFTQCHFFAGIGVWSYALRQAGWSDDRPVWTASCPCQPFSQAGKGAGFDDERHLWPAFHHLATLGGPSVIFGEQVASKDGLAWLDLVQTDMEATGYAFGALDLCAAGVGAPHIRQRSFWMAQRNGGLGRQRCSLGNWRDTRSHAIEGAGFGGGGGKFGELLGLDDDDDARSQRHAGDGGRSIGYRERAARPVASSGVSDGMADDDDGRCAAGREIRSVRSERHVEHGRATRIERPGPTNGFWRDADWLGCRDGRWRPVEPGTFPLAHGITNRVGSLRGYGNAIVGPLATEFITAGMAYLDG